MKTIQTVDQFIDAKIGSKDDIATACGSPGSVAFITNSRQSGAGSRAFAEALLETLADNCTGNPLPQDWKIFDRGMCETVLQDRRLGGAMNELLDEDYHSRIDEWVLSLFGREGSQSVAFPRLSQLLRTVATIGLVSAWSWMLGNHRRSSIS